MKWKIALSIFVVVLTLGGLAGIKALQIVTMVKAGENMSPPPNFVEVRPAQVDQWEQRLTSVGSVAAVNGALIRAEAEGIVEKILFNPGSQVEAGSILVELESKQELAALRVAQAAEQLAKTNVRRIRELHARNSVSDAELDRAEAEIAGAQASVANLQATADKRIIRAPFAGQVGVREISPGEYITKGQALVPLQAFDEVFIDFNLPQSRLSMLSDSMEVRVRCDAWPEETFIGQLTAINPDVDPITRNLSAQATLDNSEAKLRPGMYVEVTLVLPETRKVIFVPRSAILHATYGDTVFVVEKTESGEGETVRQQIVRLGESKGDFVEIIQGLDGTESVVSAGAFKLRDGAAIARSSVGTMEPSLDPQPSEG